MPHLIILRDELLDKIVNNAHRGIHTWVLAPEYYGKTTLLQEAVDELEDKYNKEVIFCEESNQFKPLMLDIAEELHKRSLFHWDQVDATEMSWVKLHAKLSRPSIIEVAPFVIQSLQGNDLILVLDHMEQVGPKYHKYVAELFGVCTIIAASNSLRNVQVKKLSSRTRIVEVSKLSSTQAQELSDFLFESYQINTSNEEGFKREIVRAADNIPGKLKQLYEDASMEQFIDQKYIRQMQAKAGKEFVSMGWLFLVLLVLPMAGRIFAVGSGDKDAYVVFGVLSAFTFVLRYLVYRGSRKPS